MKTGGIVVGVTLNDIAKKADVSASTVSRVINDDQEKPASEDTKEKVWKYVRELGYIKNKKNNLKKAENKKTNKIGLITNKILLGLEENPFVSMVIEGMKTKAKEYNYSIGFKHMQSDLDNPSVFHKVMNENIVDGIIIMAEYLKEDIQKELKKKYEHIVVANYSRRTQLECDRVHVNRKKAASQAVNYLIELGHERIAYLGGIIPGEIFNSVKQSYRFAGYKMAMENKSLNIDENYIKNGEWSLEGGFEKTRELLSLKNKPSAIFAASDLMGIGALRAINDAKLKVPEDISVVSFDDIEISRYTNPPLTTVHFPKEEKGKLAVWILIQRMKGELNGLPLNVNLPTELKIRESAGPKR